MERSFIILLLVGVVVAGSRDCRYGAGCVFPCRCISGDRCVTDSGFCQHGCGPGALGHSWGGPSCQVGNIALGKTTTQNGVSNDMTSDRAVDGYIATNASEYNCARVHNTEGEVAEWSVDLEHLSKVESLLIYSTFNPDMASTITNFSFIVRNETGSEHVCHHFTGRAPVGYMATLSINCIPPAYGRYVVLRRFGKKNPEWLTLCEVIITGSRYIDCSLCPVSCNNIQGCTSCSPGKRLPDCRRPCEAGFYGATCAFRCGSCRGGSSECNPVNGDCSGGCQAGYMGNRCDAHMGSAGGNRPDQGRVTGYPSYTNKHSTWGTGPQHPEYNSSSDARKPQDVQELHGEKTTTVIHSQLGTNAALPIAHSNWTHSITILLIWVVSVNIYNE